METPTITTNTAALALLIGGLMPLLLSVLKQVNWPKWVNLIICIVTCAGAGVLTVWVRGGLDWSNWLITFALIFAGAETMYAAWWKPSGIDTKVAKATNIS